MQLTKIKIKNYRLLVNAELEVDPKTTLIVGRNNTAKTSCFSCIENVLKKETISFDDYPLSKRDNFYTQIALFMEKKLSYEELCKQIEVTSIEFLVDYSLDDQDDNLGALSPFIIDVDVNTTTALIHAEYQLKTDEKALWDLLESNYYKDGTFSPNGEEHKAIADNFSKLFGLTIYAINPNNFNDKQVKSQKELQELFPLYAIPAERVLGEDETHNSSLTSLISDFFDMSEAEMAPEIANGIKRLRTIVESANKDVQKQSDKILSTVVNSSLGFGYPNIEELELGVTTQLSIDDQIRNKTKLSYVSGKTAKSILISCGARLAPFDIQEVRDVTAYDELQLDTLGDKKTALFLIMSDTDATFNFLISMIYTQLFNLLCEKADDVYGGRLPVHVRCLIDEMANIGQIPNLEKLVATIRSREISACLVLQAQSQLKAIYKDNADTIIGNMDSRIFLGGSEPTTLKELNQALGKETIDTYNTSNTRGNSPSYGLNYQKLGKDLASVDELAVLDGSKCILQLRGVRPFLSDKYDLTQHPNYKYTSDFDKRNEFNIEQFLSRRLKLKAGDEFVVVDAD